jgi:hypothetical protein
MPSVTLSSIVSSLSGSNLTGGVGGPLGVLYENKYQSVTYHYPRNLGTDSTRKHWIGFTILEPDQSYSSNIVGDTQHNYAVLSNEDAAFEDGKNIDYASGFVASATDVYNKASSAVQAIAQSDVKRRPRSYIALYVPDTVNVSYSSQYNDQVELTSALGLPYFLAQAGSSVADVI